MEDRVIKKIYKKYTHFEERNAIIAILVMVFCLSFEPRMVRMECMVKVLPNSGG